MKTFYTVFTLLIINYTSAQTQSNKEYDLSLAPQTDNLLYEMESQLINYAPDGNRTSRDILRLKLKYNPAQKSGAGEQFTCLQFSLRLGDSIAVDLQALQNWNYTWLPDIDNKGQVFGVDHARFENLRDSQGNDLPPGMNYHVYNAFIDFHAFVNIFAAETTSNSGIQALTQPGQQIVHEAAFSRAPTNLGSDFLEGSYFRNGKIMLSFLGVGQVSERDCAVLGLDSGDSHFKMLMQPAPGFDISTSGHSHYKATIYKDLINGIVHRVDFSEWVISATKVPQQKDINSIIERTIRIALK